MNGQKRTGLHMPAATLPSGSATAPAGPPVRPQPDTWEWTAQTDVDEPPMDDWEVAPPDVAPGPQSDAFPPHAQAAPDELDDDDFDDEFDDDFEDELDEELERELAEKFADDGVEEPEEETGDDLVDDDVDDDVEADEDGLELEDVGLEDEED